MSKTNKTAQQFINAVAASTGKPRSWVVMSAWNRGEELKPSSPMTYREACAIARGIRQACGYANVERAA